MSDPFFSLSDPARLNALLESGLLLAQSLESFDRLARLGATLLHVPMAAVTVVDAEHQRFPGAFGLPDAWAASRAVPLSSSFCQHVVRSGETVSMEDTRRDERMQDSPAVQEVGIASYLGVPLRTQGGDVLGAVCVMDSMPHSWSPREVEVLTDLGVIASDQVALRTALSRAETTAEQARSDVQAAENRLSPVAPFLALMQQSLFGVVIIQNGRFGYVNGVFEHIFGYSATEALALESVLDVIAEEDRGLVEDNLRRRLAGEVDSLQYTLRGRRKDGEEVPVEVYGIRTEADGKPAILGIVLDQRERVRAEAALRESEQRFRGIFDATYQFIGLLSPDGTLLEANQAALTFGGLTRADVIGRPFWETRWWTLSRETQARLREAVEQAARGESVRYQTEVLAAGESVATIDFSLRPISDETGRVVLIIPEASDITRSVRALASAKETEERLRSILRAIDDVIWEWDIDMGHLIWSENAERAFRYAPGEMDDSIEWWYERIHPDERERVVTDLHALLNGTGEFWSDEYRFRRGDDSYASVLDRGYVRRNARGAPVRAIGAMMDITERRRNEDAQRFLVRASVILDSSLDSGVTLPGLARLMVPTYADLCRIDLFREDGSSRPAAIAHSVPALESLLAGDKLSREENSTPFTPIPRAVRAGEPVLVTSDVSSSLSRLGETDAACAYWERLEACSLLVVPVLAHEHVLGALTLGMTDSRRHYGPQDLMLAQDVARRIGVAQENAQLYAAAQQAIQSREQVLNVVSHDLRNPLSTVVMGVELLQTAGQERREENRKWLDTIGRATAQMDAMIGDLLDAARIDGGGLSVDPADYDAAALLEETKQAFAPLAAQKKIHLTYHIPEGMSRVWVDAPQIQRVLSNLIGNAVKFTPEGGSIDVSAERRQDSVCFSVSDSGPGIGANELPHVFDRYWQGREGDRRGAGLGLAIAQGIVKAHHGRIWVKSEPEQGTTFFFTVPLADPSAARPES